ncbi:MAG: CCA tRNA nucleotidyltransferase [Clostridia bacterium]|nr:CCA tRNA nucleotidyltransferase [Clostridia bacterium]
MELRSIPQSVAAVMEKINAAGQEAYLVGGCVRDAYRGHLPHDYDITTSALPEEMLRIFAGERIIPTGLQHGTVTVLTADGPVEVTTYRQDGDYSDHRHPDGVTFTRSLREDLARRDFTMNAMALDRDGALIDPFGGREDLDRGLIRCVGEAERRFEEDALRILRGLRFAARLGFSLEEETARAMVAKKQLLKEIAAERIFAELCGLLAGEYAAEVLEEYGAVLLPVLPELKLDARALSVLKKLPQEPALRLAALLSSEDGGVLNRLKVSNAFREEVLLLLRERDAFCPPERIAVRRRMSALGAMPFITLCRYQRAEDCLLIAERLLEEGACLSVQQLAVTGRDLMALGLKGPSIGEALARLLEQVIEEKLPNEREALLAYIK